MFFEEWELLTDPQLNHGLPQIYLSGIATLNEDELLNEIGARKAQVEKEIQKAREIELEKDALDNIPEPEEPKPDNQDPETFKNMFEENNKHLGLYYTPSVMNQLFELF